VLMMSSHLCIVQRGNNLFIYLYKIKQTGRNVPFQVKHKYLLFNARTNQMDICIPYEYCLFHIKQRNSKLGYLLQPPKHDLHRKGHVFELLYYPRVSLLPYPGCHTPHRLRQWRTQQFTGSPDYLDCLLKNRKYTLCLHIVF